MALGVDDAVGAGLTLAQTAVGIINAGKTKKNAERLKRNRPQYEESPYVKDELSLAQSEVANGMSAQAKSAYEQGLDRSLSTSLDAILKSGGSANNVAQVFDDSAQGRQRLTLMSEQLRLSKINNLVGAQRAAEEERKNAWSSNQFNPWADEVQANAAARQKAQDQIWGGAQAFGSIAMGIGQRGRQQKQLNNYFNTNPQPSGPSGYSTVGVDEPNFNFNDFATPMATLQNTTPHL